MAVLDDWVIAISRVLDASHTVSSSITGHALILGDAREVLVRDILSRLLPANVVVGTGQILDSEGTRSKQIDVVIYRSDFPILRTLGSSDVFLVEGVLAAIEVKSTLDRSKFDEALQNCLSVKNHKVRVTPASLNDYCEAQFGDAFKNLDTLKCNWVLDKLLPPCYVFGYQGYKTNRDAFSNVIIDFANKNNLPIGQLPDVVASEGCVAVKNLGLPFRFTTPDGKWWGVVASTDAAPLRFLLSHLLFGILHATGQRLHMGTSIQYSISEYIKPQDRNEGDWKGVFGDVRDISERSG